MYIPDNYVMLFSGRNDDFLLINIEALAMSRNICLW